MYWVIGNQPVPPILQDGGSVGRRVLRYPAEDPTASCPSQHLHYLCRLQKELGSNETIQSKWSLPPQTGTSRPTYGISRVPHTLAGVIGRRPVLWVTTSNRPWWWWCPMTWSKLTGCLCEMCKTTVSMSPLQSVERRWVLSSCEASKTEVWIHLF